MAASTRKVAISSVRPAHPVPAGRQWADTSEAKGNLSVVVMYTRFPDMKADVMGQIIMSVEEAVELQAALGTAIVQAQRQNISRAQFARIEAIDMAGAGS